MTVPVNGHACCDSASLSCAKGWPSSVNTFISCRLTAAAVEQKTSSGMNQMKEQIIPSSPWMTCSSDPESVFASLSSLRALLPKCGIGKSGYVCMCVCMWASVRALLFSGYPLLIGLFQSLLANDEFQSIVATTCWNLIWWNGGCQHLMYSIFPLNLRAATQAALSLSFSLPSGSGLLSVQVPPCVSVRGSWPTWLLPDLENRKSAASWLSPLNLTPNIFLLSASLVVPVALNPLTTIDRFANYSRTVEGNKEK